MNVRQALSELERTRTKRPERPTAFAHASTAGGSAALSLNELQGLPRPTLLFESPDRYLDGNLRSPLHSAFRFWNMKPNTAVTSLAFLVLFGVSTALQRYESAAALDRHDMETMQTVVQGSVIPEGASHATSSPAAPTSPGTTLARNSMPAPSTQTAPHLALPQTPAAPAPAPTPAHAPSTAVAAQPPSSAPSEAPHGDRHSKLMSLALARAHDGLDKNDLRKARSGVFWALSIDRDNSEALALKQELLARERGHSGT
ncbi:hypothetical protein AAHK20_14515 [Trinickia sp. YCB016]